MVDGFYHSPGSEPPPGNHGRDEPANLSFLFRSTRITWAGLGLGVGLGLGLGLGSGLGLGLRIRVGVKVSVEVGVDQVGAAAVGVGGEENGSQQRQLRLVH